MDTILNELIKGQVCGADEYSPAVLAYAGDAVFELYVRTSLIKGGNQPVNQAEPGGDGICEGGGAERILRENQRQPERRRDPNL